MDAFIYSMSDSSTRGTFDYLKAWQCPEMMSDRGLDQPFSGFFIINILISTILAVMGIAAVLTLIFYIYIKIQFVNLNTKLIESLWDIIVYWD